MKKIFLTFYFLDLEYTGDDSSPIKMNYSTYLKQMSSGKKMKQLKELTDLVKRASTNTFTNFDEIDKK